MSYLKVLSVVPVTDLAKSIDWYERLLARPPDARPMDDLADWHVTSSAWIQVYRDEERAGSSMLNLVVEDIERRVSELVDVGISFGEITTTEGGVRLAPTEDPDGNAVTLIENPSG